MPVSEGMQARIGFMWMCVIGCIATILMQSPIVFLFAFALLYCFFGLLKEFGESSAAKSRNDDIEMQPLEQSGKIDGNMTLGELLAKY